MTVREKHDEWLRAFKMEVESILFVWKTTNGLATPIINVEGYSFSEVMELVSVYLKLRETVSE